jgi:predicted nucleic acid-binding Zn ribbon protein
MSLDLMKRESDSCSKKCTTIRHRKMKKKKMKKIQIMVMKTLMKTT